MTDDRVITAIVWRPLTSDDSASGWVTLEHDDGTTEHHGRMTRADTARFAALIFEGSVTRISPGDRIVRWIGR